MPDKHFEEIVRFYPDVGLTTTIWQPLVSVDLIRPDGQPFTLPLLFDTGASTTTLRHNLFPLLGVNSWEDGEPLEVLTAGGEDPVRAYRFQATLHILGKVIHCPIHLQKLPAGQCYMGLLGRELIFEHFGFGFWERTHELYVTLNP